MTETVTPVVPLLNCLWKGSMAMIAVIKEPGAGSAMRIVILQKHLGQLTIVAIRHGATERNEHRDYWLSRLLINGKGGLTV